MHAACISREKKWQGKDKWFVFILFAISLIHMILMRYHNMRGRICLLFSFSIESSLYKKCLLLYLLIFFIIIIIIVYLQFNSHISWDEIHLKDLIKEGGRENQIKLMFINIMNIWCRHPMMTMLHLFFPHSYVSDTYFFAFVLFLMHKDRIISNISSKS